ncbi:MAG: FMN-binding protein [Pirellulaceae bacterium]|nr:FMN-binding protein [Pirellulaceae bacterium]
MRIPTAHVRNRKALDRVTGLPHPHSVQCVTLASFSLVCLMLAGCGGDGSRPVSDAPVVSQQPAHEASAAVTEDVSPPSSAVRVPDDAPPVSQQPAALSDAGPTESAPTESPPVESASMPRGENLPLEPTSDAVPGSKPLSLDEQLASLQIPPPWLDAVTTSYDTSNPWKDARLEIRRLFSLNRPEAHREGIKLTWLYLQKDDIGDGHEYAMYTLLGGEPLWSVRAHEEYLNKPHNETPIHAYLSLASLYAQFGEFQRGEACLDRAMAGLPKPPWDVMRKADVLAAYGDLYADWGQAERAKESYSQAAHLYPTAKPPYGGHLLPRRAAEVQSKLDRLTFRSLQTASLKDGQYRDKALGYAGDIDVTVTIQNGRISEIRLKHEEKIDQNACVIIPERIKASQSLEVDGISGATVSKDAIVNGVFRCLKQAGLE